MLSATWGTYGGWSGERDVATADDARALCREIESTDDSGRVLVGFTDERGHFLAIGLGADESCVMFWESAEPPYFQSRGTGSADERIDFAYDGQVTELPRSVLVGRELALAALTEFADSGRRPGCVTWDET